MASLEPNNLDHLPELLDRLCTFDAKEIEAIMALLTPDELRTLALKAIMLLQQMHHAQREA